MGSRARAMVMEVGYWKIRGLGAPLRMMCAFKEEEVTHYAANSGEMWFGSKKPELAASNSLINLPFIVDGEQVITQSNSCMLYLGQKLQIDAPANAIKNHQALDQVMDLRNDVIKIVYPNWKASLRDLTPAASNQRAQTSIFGR